MVVAVSGAPDRFAHLLLDPGSLLRFASRRLAHVLLPELLQVGEVRWLDLAHAGPVPYLAATRTRLAGGTRRTCSSAPVAAAILASVVSV